MIQKHFRCLDVMCCTSGTVNANVDIRKSLWIMIDNPAFVRMAKSRNSSVGPRWLVAPQIPLHIIITIEYLI